MFWKESFRSLSFQWHHRAPQCSVDFLQSQIPMSTDNCFHLMQMHKVSSGLFRKQPPQKFLPLFCFPNHLGKLFVKSVKKLYQKLDYKPETSNFILISKVTVHNSDSNFVHTVFAYEVTHHSSEIERISVLSHKKQ